MTDDHKTDDALLRRQVRSIDLEAIRRRNERNLERWQPFDEPPDRAWGDAFNDIDALLDHVLDLNAIIGDYIKSAQTQATKIDTILEETRQLRRDLEALWKF